MEKSIQLDHEVKLVRAFFLPQRQERYLDLLSGLHRRKSITDQLAHFKHVDTRWAFAVPKDLLRAADVALFLNAKGAPDTCYVISEDDDLDGKEISLAKALAAIIGRGIGTFLSCLPGKLAYFEDEDDRWILQRSGKA